MTTMTRPITGHTHAQDQTQEHEHEASAGHRIRPALRLQQHMAAVAVSFTWLGVRRTLTAEQKTLAAEQFGAQGKFLSAGKKLFDTRHPHWKQVTAIKGRIQAYWKHVSLPFPEPGVRLIRRQDVGGFNGYIQQLRSELDAAVAELDSHFGALREQARLQLGRLYDPGDYPEQLRGLFTVEVDWPNVEPPAYLLRLTPELYEQERERIAARFEQAVQLAEEAFIGELAGLVSHLSERLSGAEDGKPKVFRDSAVGNLRQFFDRFRMLNVQSNQQLEELVDQAQGILRGVSAPELRHDRTLRQQVATQMSQVQHALDELLVDRPRRRLIRGGGGGCIGGTGGAGGADAENAKRQEGQR